ncbi:hypothetical protein FC093_19840 [Ilyomonas limi]|uniref:DUF3098 domain-containing protein n=1 Tax=Ilyomonas limi TaxID=2575867 RepID=A0A4U3KTC4_9BACT|nr:hypothetical protein [Ilyomonas limi]TKK65572.1 hypothetical protein FC093_19840 [Ilyomonas limi]
MFNKLNNLGFIIGIFFIIVALILLIGGLLSPALAYALNFYTGGAFLVFGVAMAVGSGRK